MFGTDHDERTLTPTPRRLAEARRLGDAPRSRELTAGLAALGGAAALWLCGPHLWEAGTDVVRTTWSAPRVRMGAAILPEGSGPAIARAATIVVAILAVPVIGAVIAGLLPVGFRVVARLPQLHWSAVNPAAGWRRLRGSRGWLAAGSLLLKLAAAGVVVGWTAAGPWRGAAPPGAQTSTTVAGSIGGLVAACGLRLTLVLLVLSLGDWWIQHRAFVRRWRMTPREQRDEALDSKSRRPRRTRPLGGVSASLRQGNRAPATPVPVRIGSETTSD